ncbi:hypothetical protein PU560_12990 [Georgenia sp. 10Sc9-8]|uniref:Uncharacterized protein n=1 Tax=Georgenia halotolerans TaxID=3028317 RepID=A0ABT5TZ81_9MICO|nr:hypothetical protein [Georgenia halotolerans]
MPTTARTTTARLTGLGAVTGLTVDMPVDPVGVAADGQTEIPEDAARAGWYRFGATVGAAAGTTVIAEFVVVDVSREPYDGAPAHSGDSIVRGELF